MSVGTTSRVFRFETFELDEATGELRKAGIRIKLHLQPLQVLIMLVERPSHVISREELRQRLWGDDTFVDFDHGLNTAVNKLRQALRDSAAEPRFIETLPGKGYRFIAPVVLQAPVIAPVVLQAPVIAPVMLQTPPVEEGAEPAKPEEPEIPLGGLLAAPHELPSASRKLIQFLLLSTQLMYLAFYIGALANLAEIDDLFRELGLSSPVLAMTLLVTTAATLIPVRLFISAAVVFNAERLAEKFHKLLPVLLPMDLLWALSPFLLLHHVNIGLALGMTAALVYLPFAQRSLVLMYTRR